MNRKWLRVLAATCGCVVGSLRAEFVDPTYSEDISSTTADVGEPALNVKSASALLRVVHPKDGATLSGASRTFVYGWSQPGGTVSVNGVPAMVHEAGGWLAMVDLSPGVNVIRIVRQAAGGVSSTVERTITVGGGASSPSLPESLRPDEDIGTVPGVEIPVSFRAATGGDAYFQIEGVKRKFPMTEVGGTYRGFFVPTGKDLLDGARVSIHFEPKSGKTVRRKAAGRVTVWNPESPRIVETVGDGVVLRAGPGFSAKDSAGYVMFLPAGVRLRATGFQGNELSVRLTRDRDAWVNRGDVKELPRGTASPRAVAYGATVLPDGRNGVVRLAMSQKAPFDVTVSEDSRVVDVRFYGVFSNTDWIHLHKDVPWIRMVRWFQDATDVYRLSIETDVPSWWGYDAGYDGGAFVLSLRRPPAMGNVKFPLEGLTVAVDAGHSSDTGAVGITGVAEREVNRDIAARLKKKLEADRARVVMIRSGDDDVPLYDRPKKAWAARADVLISVHNNALPDGENPFEKNGFGVYYYHPMALSLARDIHEAYQGMFGFGKNALKMTMRDDGLHWGNLALPRTPQMPSVLTESAYMIYPPEEWALQQPPFQEDCAEAMRQGLKTYVRRMRPTR